MQGIALRFPCCQFRASIDAAARTTEAAINTAQRTESQARHEERKVRSERLEDETPSESSKGACGLHYLCGLPTLTLLSQAVLKYTRAVTRQSKADGKFFRNVVVHGNWDPKAKLRQRRLRQNSSSPDPRLSRASSDAPSLSPSDALDVPPCDEDDYPVSDASTDDEECYTATPMYDRDDRLLDSKEAYCWFHLIHISVYEFAWSDFKLASTCSPLVLVAMVHVGWISLSDAVSWTESRHMLGEGLVRAHMVRNIGRFGHLVDRMKEMKKPTADEMHRNHLSWERGRDPKRKKDYDWQKDSLDRIVHGPFGPALSKYTKAEELEKALMAMLHSLPCAVKTYPKLDAVLDPLVTRKRTMEEQKASRTWLTEDVSMRDDSWSEHSTSPRKTVQSRFDFFFRAETSTATRSLTAQRYHPYRPALKKHKARRWQQCLGEAR